MTVMSFHMRRAAVTCFAMLGTSAAQAHPGHLTDLAGHDHWVAGAAIGLAIALGLYGALKGKPTGAKPAEADAESAEDTPEEARA
jgi:hypothetical protein